MQLGKQNSDSLCYNSGWLMTKFPVVFQRCCLGVSISGKEFVLVLFFSRIKGVLLY